VSAAIAGVTTNSETLSRGRSLVGYTIDMHESLVAPQSLREAFERHGRAEMDDAELHAAQDRAIVDVVRKQRQHTHIQTSTAKACNWRSLERSRSISPGRVGTPQVAR
jgi:hypothetical protein